MADKIIVKISCDDVPLQDGPEAYFDAVQNILEQAGVKFTNNNANGKLFPTYNPDDFGSTIWTFIPED